MQKGKFLFYKVIIGDGALTPVNRLELELNEQEFYAINLSVFIDLGLVVVVHKIFEDGEVQDT